MISLPLNFAWEMLQMPAFEGFPAGWLAMVGVCARAAVGDALIAVLLSGLGIFLFDGRRWFVPPRLSRYAVVVGAGFMLHLLIEWYSVHRLALWSYAPLHPIIPGLRVGLVPALQPLILLPVTFSLLSKWSTARV